MKSKRGPQLLMATGVLLPLALFFFPLWQIILEAAQFPEGLWMYIWINKISGSSEHILQNVNILNHYIGMKYIEPDSIPELVYFPWVVGGMAVLGLLAALTNKSKWFMTWFVVMSILGILGIYDFYLWLVDYGTNLDPNAPIVVPGMTYQPPLLGTKELLNFVAHSYPATGAWFLSAGLGATFFAALWKRRIERAKKKSNKMGMALTPLLLVFTSCSVEPQPIAFGEDHCDFCRMTIVDPKYGAELVNVKGKTWKFDAAECMVQFMNQEQKTESEFVHILAIPYDSPESLVPVKDLSFLISEQLPSPMGANLSAFSNTESAQNAQTEYGGTLHTWPEVPEQITLNTY